jgi:formylglycine-generating enzyme required for sulfatase activity
VKPSPNQILASELEQTLREGNVQKALSMVRTTLGEDPSNETAIEYAGHIYEVAGDGVLDQDEVIWLKALLGKAGDKSSRKPSLGVEETSPTTSALVSISGGAFESTFGGTYIMPSFEMQKCPVTNAEYKAFIKETGELPPAHWLGNEPPADALDAPVVGVSIGDARRYAAWCGMRLPTTAEWEAAVRLPDGRQFPWGNEWKSEYCHCKENGASEPGPVGQYPLGASHFGCLDLLGNVWEWTEHHEGMKPPETGYYWVMGGSFRHPCEKNGKIARTDVSENGAYPYLGFRCVRELQRKRK